MKERTLPRKPVVLSEYTQRRLGMYALSASAAGVSMLAQAQLAEAKIIYTPTHLVISKPNGVRHCVDMNHDGKMDFCLAFSGHEGCFVEAIGGSYQQGGIAASSKGIGALAIPAGKRIGRSGNFVNTRYFPQMVRFANYCSDSMWSGLWIVDGKSNKGLHNRYLGIRFASKGKVYYGWARCSVYPPPPNDGRVVMTGYAYETIPNKPIIAGKTKSQDVVTLPVDTKAGTLGHLTLGRK